jgi:hypothetical protein
MDEEIMDFDATAGLEDPPSGEFKAGGRVWHIRASIPIMPFANAWTTGPNGEQRMQVEKLVQMCLVPDEVEDFTALLQDPARSPITNRNMQAFFDFIMEKAGKVPPAEPSSSPNGSATNGHTSVVRSSVKAGRQRQLPSSRST